MSRLSAGCEPSRNRTGGQVLLKDQTEEGPWFGRWGVTACTGPARPSPLDTIALTARDIASKRSNGFESSELGCGFGEIDRVLL